MTDRLIQGGVVAAVVVVAVVAFWFAFLRGHHMNFKVVGGPCSAMTGGGTLYSRSSGFTPNGKYATLATVDGVPYKDVRNPGVADVYGRTSSWHWVCGDGPAGHYQVTIVDLSTGNHATAKFTVYQFKK